MKRAAHPLQFFLELPPPPPEFLVVFWDTKGRSLCQVFLDENVETGTKNRCMIEAMYVLRRKLKKD